MKKRIKLGLIGFGTVGSGVVDLIRKNNLVIEKRLGASLEIKTIADKDLIRPRNVSTAEATITDSVSDILNDPEISIVIELVGGLLPAKNFIIDAMEKKKHVVTANKALLATYGNEIFEKADEEKVNIGFEASVGGAIPVIKTIKESLAANNIVSVFGIMNGTCNYILTRMTDENLPFEEVLKEAQRLGFAEADPTYDIDGIDTAHKLAITLALSYGKRVRLEDIYREGISNLDRQDVEFASQLGYRIKLLAIAIQRGEEIEARIHPTMIPFNHLLSSVNGNYNAFHFEGDHSGSVLLHGQGAGMKPTASAVVSDIIDIARDMEKKVWRRVPLRAFKKDQIQDIKLLSMDDVRTNYYFRFSAFDRPGVLSKISGILGSHSISIASVIQKGRKDEGAVPVVMTTHESRERDVREALEEIDKLDIVLDKTVLIRIEGGQVQ
ncbi:MAG: homoserine dehydrogenase [Syntrophales bacterium]|jgi:homoserine dehydrogenase|nr:homoserine dehydrogenase [Syntrophales bacterium]MDY0044163.1 homoserine dehydrogenase [Syntrophales bacterium]